VVVLSAQLLRFARDALDGSVQIARERWRHVVVVWCCAHKSPLSLRLGASSLHQPSTTSIHLRHHQQLLLPQHSPLGFMAEPIPPNETPLAKRDREARDANRAATQRRQEQERRDRQRTIESQYRPYGGYRSPPRPETSPISPRDRSPVRFDQSSPAPTPGPVRRGQEQSRQSTPDAFQRQATPPASALRRTTMSGTPSGSSGLPRDSSSNSLPRSGSGNNLPRSGSGNSLPRDTSGSNFGRSGSVRSIQQGSSSNSLTKAAGKQPAAQRAFPDPDPKEYARVDYYKQIGSREGLVKCDTPAIRV
jgi:hypothetical protein